jgi:RNA polymerase sigma-32 factor
MEKRMAGPEASLDVSHPVTGRSLMDTLSIEGKSPEQEVASTELYDRVRLAMKEFRATLDERERAIWDTRIQAESPSTFQEIGDEHGITRQRVQQVEQRLKDRFKEYLLLAIPEADGRLIIE